MPKLECNYLWLLLIPEVGIWIWFPIVAFILYAIKAWKQDRALHRATFNNRERWRLATPAIVVLEMLVIGALLVGNRDLRSLESGFGYLFLSLFPLTAYLTWRHRKCGHFTLRYCLALCWLAAGIGLALVAATVGG